MFLHKQHVAQSPGDYRALVPCYLNQFRLARLSTNLALAGLVTNLSRLVGIKRAVFVDIVGARITSMRELRSKAPLGQETVETEVSVIFHELFISVSYAVRLSSWPIHILFSRPLLE